MSVTIVPKKSSVESDSKKGSNDNRLASKNRDIVIKRSKSTGIVLKQKKSHIGSIKHFHPRSVNSSAVKSNETQKTLKKPVAKEPKETKPRVKTVVTKEEKPKAKKPEPISPAVPVTKEKTVAAVAKDNIEISKTSEANIDKQTVVKEQIPESKAVVAKSQPEFIKPASKTVPKGSCDSGETLTDKKYPAKEPLSHEDKASVAGEVNANEKEFNIKNGLNTPPLSTLNTSSNSDVEMINDETNKVQQDPVEMIKTQPKTTITNIPSKPVVKSEETSLERIDLNITNENIIKKEVTPIETIEKQKSSSNTNMDPLSGIKSESVPMTPSYTKSIDDKKKNLVEEPQNNASFLKSPKEESLDGVKLSKKASQLKKKIIQRKSKNDVLKIELNQLIENLQHLKKQYDMISTTFNEDFDDTSLKKDIDPESLINTAMEGINKNFVKEHVAQSKSDMSDIPGYYVKRSGDAVFGDIGESNAYLTETKKRKTAFTTPMESTAQASNVTKTVNDILSSNFAFNPNASQDKLIPDLGNLPLLTFDDILQPSEKKIMDFALDDNVGPGIDDKRAMSNGFDFLLDINDNLPLEDDINMDFFNF